MVLGNGVIDASEEWSARGLRPTVSVLEGYSVLRYRRGKYKGWTYPLQTSSCLQFSTVLYLSDFHWSDLMCFSITVFQIISKVHHKCSSCMVLFSFAACIINKLDINLIYELHAREQTLSKEELWTASFPLPIILLCIYYCLCLQFPYLWSFVCVLYVFLSFWALLKFTFSMKIFWASPLVSFVVRSNYTNALFYSTVMLRT